MTAEVGLGIVRGISYGLFGEPGSFVPEARALGARLVRSYLYWGQVEPRPGEYRWGVVDALLDQLDGDEEVWLTVCASSPWATRVATDFLPPSPPKDPGAYREFVRRLVRHCGGRVAYWQCENEPSNTALLWSGTAEEYVEQLSVLHEAVKDTDPDATVVLGGCGFDVFAGAEGSPARAFFDHVLAAGRDRFDVFSANLYGPPREVPHYLDTAERMMAAHGYRKPIFVGEHGGPVLFEFPELEPILQQVMIEAFAEAPATQSTGELAERARQDTPERRALRALAGRMGELPPRLRMFLPGCPPELENKRHRINCRQLVQRTVLALAAGVRRTAYWNLAPEIPGPVDPNQLMYLMFGKLPLLDYRDGRLTHRYPAAGTFALLSGKIDGARRVTRLDVAGPPTVTAFEVERPGRPRLLVLWDDRDTFDGEDDPALPVSLPWSSATATAVDALGTGHPVKVADGRVHLDVSDTPVFVCEPRGQGVGS
jgi:hypothetical protein